MFPIAVLMIRDEEERARMTEIYEQYSPYIYKCIDKFLGPPTSFDDRSDLFQDVLLRLIQQIGTIKNLKEGQLCSYILMTAKSAVFTFLNRHKKNAPESLELLKESGFESEDSEAPPLFEGLEAEEEEQEILRLMNALPLKEREALLFRYFFNMKDDEIAPSLGVAESSVRVYVTRGRKRLLKLLHEKEKQL